MAADMARTKLMKDGVPGDCATGSQPVSIPDNSPLLVSSMDCSSYVVVVFTRGQHRGDAAEKAEKERSVCGARGSMGIFRSRRGSLQNNKIDKAVLRILFGTSAVVAGRDWEHRSPAMSKAVPNWMCGSMYIALPNSRSPLQMACNCNAVGKRSCRLHQPPAAQGAAARSPITGGAACLRGSRGSRDSPEQRAPRPRQRCRRSGAGPSPPARPAGSSCANA